MSRRQTLCGHGVTGTATGTCSPHRRYQAVMSPSITLLYQVSFACRDAQAIIFFSDFHLNSSLETGKGRGATEIDLVEVMPGPNTKLPMLKNNVRRPYSSMTLQLAPGIPATQHRPFAGTLPEWGFTW